MSTPKKYESLLGSLLEQKRANVGPKKSRTKNIIVHDIKYNSHLESYEVTGYVLNDSKTDSPDTRTNENWFMGEKQLDSIVETGTFSFGAVTWTLLSK